jgi:hypothetical protein
VAYNRLDTALVGGFPGGPVAIPLARAGLAGLIRPATGGRDEQLLLKNASKNVTWTVAALKDNGSYSLAGSCTFKNNSSFAPGWYEADVTWPAPGEYQLRFVPSSGSEVPYTMSVQPVGGAAPTVAQIDAQLSNTHGAGSWGSAPGSFTVLPFQGSVSYETTLAGADVHVIRGDSVSVPYSIGKDITGWTVWFGAKASTSDVDYAVPLREVTASVTDASTGSGLVDLSTVDTDIMPRRYQAELEIRKDGSVNTPLRFYLWIDADVIR